VRRARSQSLDAWPRAIGLINVFVHYPRRVRWRDSFGGVSVFNLIGAAPRRDEKGEG
jgi:hypothetical protein